MPLSNAQYVESSKMNAQEICRIFNIPGPKVGIIEGTPYNSLESLNVDYWQNCILPIVTMYEQEVNMKVFNNSENVFIEHNFDSILIADAATKADVDTKMFRIGVLSRNEIRASKGLNKVPLGDRYQIEGNNMVPVDIQTQFLLKDKSNQTNE
jgi:HK97 family phage portal protein